MKILIIDTYYPGFLRSFWRTHRSLVGKSYSLQLKALLGECFGTSDYYSYHLNQLGHPTYDIIANDQISQLQWAKEHSLQVKSSGLLARLQMLPLLHRFLGRPNWVQTIVLAQVKAVHPDVVYLQDLSILNPATLTEIKQYSKLLVGQIACPLPGLDHLKHYDLILTSFPHYVKQFTDLGIKSEYFKIGFETRLIKRIGQLERRYDVAFVGSFSPYHSEGTAILEQLAKNIPVHVWGTGLEYLSPTSPLRANYHGEAWGKTMYAVLAQSKIVINRHIGVSGKYANNMRLYESTGMGAMLITDAKANLAKLFIPGKEVVSYRNSQELVTAVQYYLDHPAKRMAIARAGQKRTVHEHSYSLRMQELITIIAKYL